MKNKINLTVDLTDDFKKDFSGNVKFFNNQIIPVNEKYSDVKPFIYLGGTIQLAHGYNGLNTILKKNDSVYFLQNDKENFVCSNSYKLVINDESNPILNVVDVYCDDFLNEQIVYTDIVIMKQKYGSKDIKIKLSLLKETTLFSPSEPVNIAEPIIFDDSPRMEKLMNEMDNYEEGYKYKYGLAFKADNFINIEILDAYELKLSKIPKEIYKLESLKILRTQQNNISIVSKELLKLPRLEALCLCDNNLVEIPRFLTKLDNLTELGICNNKTLKQLPDNFKDLKLTSLSIDGKLLNKYIDLICQITTIEELDIQGSKISKEVFEKLTSLPNLKDLTFESIKNKRFPKNMTQFKTLEFLTIKRSQYFLQYDNNITENIFSNNIKSIEINDNEKIDNICL